MNYAQARQRSDDKLWAFTVQNDDRIWTAECCRHDDPEKHHAHASREEAEACFNAWRRAQPIEFSEGSQWNGCQVEGCDKPTKTQARMRDLGMPNYFDVCEEHATEDAVRSLIEDVSHVAYS